MLLFSRIPRPGWLAIGLGVGVVMAPAAAAAATVVVLHGSNGPSVRATNAHQLLTTDAPPSAWVSVFGSGSTAGACSNLPPVSSTRGFIVRQADVDIAFSPSGISRVFIYSGSGCQGGHEIAEEQGNGATVMVPFNPGIALTKGQDLSFAFNGPAPRVLINVLGYRVAATDVGANTPVIDCTTTCH
jgi:hypothetical protein